MNSGGVSEFKEERKIHKLTYLTGSDQQKGVKHETPFGPTGLARQRAKIRPKFGNSPSHLFCINLDNRPTNDVFW